LKWLEKKNKSLPYICMFLIICIAYLVVTACAIESAMQFLMQMLVFGTLIFTCFISADLDEKERLEKYLTAIMMIGFIMRIGYMLYTPIRVRSHDLGTASVDDWGHSAYITKILIEHRLAATNFGQYYHPPLFHLLAAVVAHFVNLILHKTDYEQIVSAGKIVSCFASCATLYMFPKLCDELGMKKKAKCIALIIFAAFPNCYLLAGRLNNDSLVVCFMMVIILYTFKWYKKQSYKNTIILALAFGLGMMTKTSCGMLALFTGPVMLYVWYKNIREHKGLPIFKRLVVFGILSFTLGLWYQVRNLIKFGQPFNYVLRIPTSAEIYTGKVPLVNRYLLFPLKRFFEPIWVYPDDDYNIILYCLKTAVFGEFKYDIQIWIPRLLLLISTVLVILSLVGMGYLVFKSKKRRMIRFGIPAVWLIVFGSYLYFYYDYPYGCTMDFRYIVPTSITGAVSIALTYEEVCSSDSVAAFLYKNMTIIFSVLFAVFSFIMYTHIN